MVMVAEGRVRVSETNNNKKCNNFDNNMENYENRIEWLAWQCKTGKKVCGTYLMLNWRDQRDEFFLSISQYCFISVIDVETADMEHQQESNGEKKCLK